MTKVRSFTVAILAALGALLGGLALSANAGAQTAGSVPAVTIGLIAGPVDAAELGSIEGVSPGLMSAGLGSVPSAQTYLDITQGNRVNPSLYPDPLPLVYTLAGGVPPRVWDPVVKRAGEAPADIEPGLLASAIAEGSDSDLELRAARFLGPASLVAVDRAGRLVESTRCAELRCPGATVIAIELGEIRELVDGLSGDDLLIVIARPLPLAQGRPLPIGIAGEGFDGNLTSGSTRLRGFVLSTDVAPTVLDRLGLPIPDAMNGQPIRAEGSVDPSQVSSLAARLDEIAPRRDGVILGNFLIWVLLAAVVAIGFGRRGRRLALPLLLVAAAYVPVLLLFTAALTPSEPVERLVVGLGGPLLAALTLLALRPYAAIATACAVSVGAQAIDVVAGSPLTALSLLGPNPAVGARFFGIGNELEATLVVLLLLGVGAAIAARGGRVSARDASVAFGVAALIGVAVFAPGRFGADVGIAIALPFGAAVAVVVLLRARARARVALLVLVAPLGALALVVAADLLLGGDAHLSQSVLQAGGLEQVGDVAQRRIALSAGSFGRNVDSPYFLVVVALIVVALLRRRELAAWFTGRPAAFAGFLGAAAATVLGTLANDSGALLLMIGTGYAAMFAGVAWATAGEPEQVSKLGERPVLSR